MACRSSTLTPALARAIPRATWIAASYIIVAVSAALPRLLGLGVFLTVDEAAFWMERSHAFFAALQSGNLAATAIAPHPGVTTMWLGGTGQLLYDAALRWGVTSDASYPAYLAWQQFPVALTHTVGVVVGYALLRRLFAPALALLAALLWATDPFVVGFSRVLHTDMLVGTFATLSLLAACVYWQHDPRPRWLIGSGVCAALAMLSKIPGVLVVPCVVGLALWAAWRPLAPERAGAASAWRALLRPLALWGAALGVTLLLVWPAIWANPAGVYDMLRFGVVSEGGEAHAQGNFFLGQALDAPGPLFYPVALVLRATPVTLLGLLLLPLAYWLWPRATRRNIVVLAAFVLLFTVALSASPKKFNRYLVPAFPAVDIVAAAGLLGLAQGTKRFAPSKTVQRAATASILAAATVASVANAAFWHPYGMAGFNQTFGGALRGANTFLIGWGEGLEQTAAWLNQQPDITGVRVASTLQEPLQRYLRPGAQAYSPRGTFDENTGYVVVYARSVQDGAPVAPFDQFYGRVSPLHITTVHGVPYAWTYQLPPPVAQPRPATVGALQLRGFDGATTAQPGTQLHLNLAWSIGQPPSQPLMLFAHVLDDDGKQVATVDLPLDSTGWRANSFVATNLVLPLPSDLAPGRYQLALGLYDPATGQRLPLTGVAPANRAPDGDDALRLTAIEVP